MKRKLTVSRDFSTFSCELNGWQLQTHDDEDLPTEGWLRVIDQAYKNIEADNDISNDLICAIIDTMIYHKILPNNLPSFDKKMSAPERYDDGFYFGYKIDFNFALSTIKDYYKIDIKLTKNQSEQIHEDAYNILEGGESSCYFSNFLDENLIQAAQELELVIPWKEGRCIGYTFDDEGKEIPVYYHKDDDDD
jgi:hypothetical protein